MADTYVGLKGKKYTVITPAIGSGGEGSVYKIVGDPDSVLKVFIENKRTETRTFSKTKGRGNSCFSINFFYEK